jgi:hypothetical protein
VLRSLDPLQPKRVKACGHLDLDIDRRLGTEVHSNLIVRLRVVAASVLGPVVSDGRWRQWKVMVSSI